MRVAMISYHTCPLATLGGKDTGGMNVYVRELTRQLGRLGVHVDVFTRSQDEHVPHVLHDLAMAIGWCTFLPGRAAVPKDDWRNICPNSCRDQEFAAQRQLSYDLVHSHTGCPGWQQVN